MKKKLFYILEGNNGATYILNAKDADSTSQSLKFYKARTIKQKVLKNALKLYLYGLGSLCKIPSLCVLRDKVEIEQYLSNLIQEPIDFELAENCSVLVSSTRDKIIVHHHGRFFHKFAFGGSYENVKNEAEIYKLLDRPLHNFEVSKFYDHMDSENVVCSFKLSSQRKSIKTDADLTLALVEMFNFSRQDECKFSTYLGDLKKRYVNRGTEDKLIKSVLEKLEDAHHNALISLGLVHRDFKPWNINDEYGLLIYDFEEAVADGPPLEDLFNYYIDPIVRYLAPSEVVKKIFKIEHVKEYKRYLEQLEIKLDFLTLLYCYLIERAIFWMSRNEKEMSDKYCAIAEYIMLGYCTK